MAKTRQAGDWRTEVSLVARRSMECQLQDLELEQPYKIELCLRNMEG